MNTESSIVSCNLSQRRLGDVDVADSIHHLIILCDHDTHGSHLLQNFLLESLLLTVEFIIQ